MEQSTTYKLIYLARRNPLVKREDWPRTWRSHAIFASQFPVLEARIDWMRYCNRVDVPVLDGRPCDVPNLSTEHDGVAVAASDVLESLNGTGFSEEDRTLIDNDELRVFDMLTPNFTYYCAERPILDGAMGEAAVFTFLARKPGVSREEFTDRWCGNDAGIGERAAAAVGTATRFVFNEPVHDPLPLFPFDGIIEAWFADTDEALRSVTGDKLPPVRRDLAEFCDLEKSVVILTTPSHRWPKD